MLVANECSDGFFLNETGLQNNGQDDFGGWLGESFSSRVSHPSIIMEVDVPWCSL